MVNVFFPKDGTIKMALASAITISNSTVLDTAFSSATTVTGQFKNFKIKSPIGDVSKIDIIGTTSGFQNAELEEKPAGLLEFTGDIIVPGDELIEGIMYGTGTAAGSTHTTYQTGLASKTVLAVLFNVDDGTDEINWAGTNIQLTANDFTMNSDGHLEANVTFKCLPRDFFGPQFKD